MCQMVKIVKNEVIDIAEQVDLLHENINTKVRLQNSKIDFLTKAISKIADHHQIDLENDEIEIGRPNDISYANSEIEQQEFG